MSSIRLSLESARPIDTANFGASDGLLHPDRVAAYHDFLFIEEGEWEVWEEEQKFVTQPGDLLTLFAGRHHFGHVPCARGTRWIYIHVLPCSGDRFMRQPAKPPEADDMLIELPSLVRTRGNRHIHQLMRDIVHCFWSTLRGNRQRARILLSEFLLTLASMSDSESAPSRASPVERVIRRIDNRPQATYSIDELADVARMSRRLLTRRFREVTGMSVRQYQIHQKVRLARSMLADNPSLRLKEVAQMLGFFDEFHFSKTFKSIVKVAPRSFRRRDARP